MNPSKLCIAVIAASTLFYSCTKIDHKTYTMSPTNITTIDKSGQYLSKREFIYDSTGQTKAENAFSWSSAGWELKHEYTFTYEYGQGNYLKTYTVIDNGAPAFRYDYSYDTNYLLAYEKHTQYVESGEKVTEYQYEYQVNNNYIKTKFVKETSGEESRQWKEEYERNSGGQILTAVTSMLEDEKYVETTKVYYTYYNGLVSNLNVQKKIGNSWLTYQNNDYSYDNQNRLVQNTVELYNLDVTPATSVITTDVYSYPD